MKEHPIKLRNTFSHSRDAEPFVPLDWMNDAIPLDDKQVRMYVCGPTVYDRAHLGNARPVVVFDVLFRLLRHVYGPDHVTYVRNFTDVDDKINARAAESGRPISEITAETTQWFLDDMAALGALEPTQMPRATQYIPQMVAMIEKLIADGHAYAAEGHVLFAVDSYKNYGALSGRSVDDMIAGARVEVAPYKRNPMDFVLWKPSTDDLPGWDSPWGRGRPGWHIECSAMSYELLGASFDIHGGGNDLMFPHHENEIAQSCCAHPEGGFANVWLHNEMLQVEGKKMSKSLGNFFTVHDLLEGHDGQPPVPGEVIRFVFLSTHYRKPMDWTAEKVSEAKATLEKWYALTDGAEPDPQGRWAVLPYLMNDLDTHGALNKMRELSRDESRREELRYAMGLLGFGFKEGNVPPPYFQKMERKSEGQGYTVRVSWTGSLSLNIQEALLAAGHTLFKLRQIAMETKDFSEVSSLQAQLKDAEVHVQIHKDSIVLVPGPNFDPAKLEALK